MNDREFSDIKIFQHLGKGIPLFMTGHKNCLQASYNNGWHIFYSQNWMNNICVENVSDQSARKYKEKFSTEIEDQGSLYPVLKSNNTEYCFFASSHWSVWALVSKPECRDFLNVIGQQI